MKAVINLPKLITALLIAVVMWVGFFSGLTVEQASAQSDDSAYSSSVTDAEREAEEANAGAKARRDTLRSMGYSSWTEYQKDRQQEDKERCNDTRRDRVRTKDALGWRSVNCEIYRQQSDDNDTQSKDSEISADEMSRSNLLARIAELRSLIEQLMTSRGSGIGEQVIDFNTEVVSDDAQRVETTERLRVREAASAFSRVVGIVERGTQGDVLDGPRRAGAHDWWYLAYDTGVTGWSAGSWLQTISDSASDTGADETDVSIQHTYEGKVVYTGSNTMSELQTDCAIRNGTFNTCGSTCAPDADMCTMACALTCEFGVESVDDNQTSASTDVNTSEDEKGTFAVYRDGQLRTTLDNTTFSQREELCQLRIDANPDVAWECTWNGETYQKYPETVASNPDAGTETGTEDGGDQGAEQRATLEIIFQGTASQDDVVITKSNLTRSEAFNWCQAYKAANSGIRQDCKWDGTVIDSNGSAGTAIPSGGISDPHEDDVSTEVLNFTPVSNPSCQEGFFGEERLSPGSPFVHLCGTGEMKQVRYYERQSRRVLGDGTCSTRWLTVRSEYNCTGNWSSDSDGR